ncbi:MAG: DNA-binding response regulator [Legionellales bacterium]|nr:DNA-binding response regulator [Legionellales bacterium]|tara:strand:- start:53879 stop:54607 length:729 start_codon:yes stop_codon:yes gene_type:complete
MDKSTILIVDDDKDINELLADLYGKYGYNVLCAGDGKAMFAILAENTVDLIVLDVMLPGDDGFALCRQLRSESNVPIIMLTAIGEDTDRIVGLEVGADDYIPKPFNPRELVARTKALLRRTQILNTPIMQDDDSDTLYFSGWCLDQATRRLVSPDEVEITLSAGEYNLLIAFIEHPRRVLSRDQLLEYTRNRSAGPFDRSIDIQVSRLRQKIEEDPKNPVIIKTVRGGGYMFTPAIEKSANV